MAKDNGSKTKSPSPSDLAYYARAKAGKLAEINREKRMRRHAKRMGITYKALLESPGYTAPGGKAHPCSRPYDPPRVILSPGKSDLPRNIAEPDYPSGFVIVDTRIVEASPRSHSLHSAFSQGIATPRAIVRVSSLGLQSVTDRKGITA